MIKPTADSLRTLAATEGETHVAASQASLDYEVQLYRYIRLHPDPWVRDAARRFGKAGAADVDTSSIEAEAIAEGV